MDSEGGAVHRCCNARRRIGLKTILAEANNPPEASAEREEECPP